MQTAQARATAATNEWIRDYVERHGENQASRDEAHERVAELEKMADEARVLVERYIVHDDPEGASDDILDTLLTDRAEKYLAACMVSALREKEDELREVEA